MTWKRIENIAIQLDAISYDLTSIIVASEKKGEQAVVDQALWMKQCVTEAYKKSNRKYYDPDVHKDDPYFDMLGKVDWNSVRRREEFNR